VDTTAADCPRFELHRGDGSTRDVDFWTSKPVREVERSHLNLVVLDTTQWEQTASFYLDRDPHVIAFAKNFNLGFAIPYNHNGEDREYLPDFLIRVRNGHAEVGYLILETKGYDPLTGIKEAAARRWIEAINAYGRHGLWAYRVVSTPTDVPAALKNASLALGEKRGMLTG
jgi:type III restriction enzyme